MTEDPHAKYIKPAGHWERLTAQLNPPKPRRVAGLDEAMREDTQRGRTGRTACKSNWPVGRR